MTTTENIFEIIKLTLPSVMVLLVSIYLVKEFLKKSEKKDALEISKLNTNITLPLRLQAYERSCLFLERISPNIMLHRVAKNAVNSIDLQRILLAEIRMEFEHNLSQQIYMSTKAWNLVCKAKEDVTNLIILSGKNVNSTSTTMDMVRAITDNMIRLEVSPVQQALDQLKSDVALLF